MRLFSLSGRAINKNVTPYLIKWSGKSRSKVQYRAKQFFKKFWQNHMVYEEFPVFGSLMKVDILNTTKKIAVEINGRQHGEYVEHFHKSKSGFYSAIHRDDMKYKWLRKNGFEVLEINEDEVDDLTAALILEKFGIDIY